MDSKNPDPDGVELAVKVTGLTAQFAGSAAARAAV
jgi:hypothetical protein